MAKVLLYKDDPDLFLHLLDREKFSYLDPVSFVLWARYHQAYFGNDCIDLSFMIIENEGATICVPCQSVERRLRNNGAPIRAYFAPGAQTRQKTQTLMDVFAELIDHHQLTDLLIRTTPINGNIDLLGDRLLKAGAESETLFISQIDLQQTGSSIRQGFRKSYSPLINWGERNIHLTYLDKHSPNEEVFEQVRQFHIHVADRVTRSEETWKIQYDMIVAGCAEIIIGHLDGQIVSAGFYMDEGLKTLYGVGIYERSLFDKPLAHYVTYQGILRAKERGQTLFIMGDVPLRAGTDDKLYKIGDFKKGFSPALTIELQWKIDYSDKEGSA